MYRHIITSRLLLNVDFFFPPSKDKDGTTIPTISSTEIINSRNQDGIQDAEHWYSHGIE